MSFYSNRSKLKLQVYSEIGCSRSSRCSILLTDIVIPFWCSTNWKSSRCSILFIDLVILFFNFRLTFAIGSQNCNALILILLISSLSSWFPSRGSTTGRVLRSLTQDAHTPQAQDVWRRVFGGTPDFLASSTLAEDTGRVLPTSSPVTSYSWDAASSNWSISASSSISSVAPTLSSWCCSTTTEDAGVSPSSSVFQPATWRSKASCAAWSPDNTRYDFVDGFTAWIVGHPLR